MMKWKTNGLLLALMVWTICSVPATGQELTVCSFNIQFLGQSKDRDDEALADIVKECDLVVVQELVAPPYPGSFPDGTDFKPDKEAAEFFDAMKTRDFDYWLSEEDTGTGARLHVNSAATEWWVVFYKSEKVARADDLTHGFLADDRSNHDDWERVPYAFSFRTKDDDFDFVLISVHLKPGNGRKDRARRKHELSAIASWIDAHDETEKDIIILGDMNLYKKEEIADVTPEGYLSLNDEARPTNTNVNGPQPYDHVMYSIVHTSEIDTTFDLKVIDLIEAMGPRWDETNGPYPGDPYDHNPFRRYYSDHHPVVFKIKDVTADDDGDGARSEDRVLIKLKPRCNCDCEETAVLVEIAPESCERLNGTPCEISESGGLKRGKLSDCAVVLTNR